jgi:hypothetical protein
MILMNKTARETSAGLGCSTARDLRASLGCSTARDLRASLGNEHSTFRTGIHFLNEDSRFGHTPLQMKYKRVC